MEKEEMPLRFYAARKSHSEDYLVVTFVEGEGETRKFRRWIVPTKARAKEGKPYLNTSSIVVPVIYGPKPAKEKKPEAGKDELPF